MNRRDFAGSSLGGLAAMLAAPTVLIGQQPPQVTPAVPATPAKPKPGLDTLFLTWQGDPTTTMTVQWVGEKFAPEDSLVQYVPIDLSSLRRIHPQWRVAPPVTTKPFPLSLLTNHRVELTGLTPGTEYAMRIGKNPQLFRFRTMPSKATNEITFVSGGDAGVNQHVIDNNKNAAKQDPLFAVIGGDLAYDNGTSSKTYLQWLRDYSKYMVDNKGRLIPMIACLGNHEVKGGFNKKREDAPFFFAHFGGLYKDTSYAALDFGDYLSLVLLDSGHTTKIAGDQTDWLDRTLKARVDMPHLMAVNHVPCYPSFRPAEVVKVAGKPTTAGTGEDQRKHWVPLFDKYGVDVVLEHHDHTFKRTHPMTGGLKDKYGVLYLGDGSWGKQRSAAQAEDRSYIAVANTTYHLTIHRLEAEQCFHMAMEETGKIVDICRTEKKPRKRG